jgi:hypothetical protein
MMSEDQVRSGGGGQATPKDLPDAPVPWERSDAVPMRPAEEGNRATAQDTDEQMPADAGEDLDEAGDEPFRSGPLEVLGRLKPGL